MKKATAAWMLAAALWAPGAGAQTATVDAVQYPAWLERGGRLVPLVPGTTLQASDGVRTGHNARVQLRLSEGSAVKLGENAQFVVERVDNGGGTFRAALSVLAGAFRFTSQQVRKRDIAIKVKNVTIGIRGTDLWGKSTDERDLVCLIEGRIAVGSDGHPTVTLDQPLDFYQRPRGGNPEVAKVDPKQLETWSAETEIARDGAAARAGGKWRVVAAAFADRDKALAFNRIVRARGYPSEVTSAEDKFAVQVPGLASEADARSLMGNLRGIRGVTLPHVKGGP
ncbi:MAG: FecR domain-containing protein [Usitatibacter sp.]